MPANLHRRQGSDAIHDNERGHTRVPDREQSDEIDHVYGTQNGHAEALQRADPSARVQLVTALQRTFGNSRVQRLIAGLGQRSSQIDRCGGMPCHSAHEDESVRRVQRLGQSPEELQAPRGASLASPAVPSRREEEEPRPRAHR
ncbi:MAG: hypothetical protein ACRDJW_14220 [Thermomicrobiales bacterium]